MNFDEATETFIYRDGCLYWKTDRVSGTGRIHIKAGTLAGSLARNGYWRINWNGRALQRSRIVFLMHNGSYPIGEIDHVNRNRSDDRIENLRDVTKQENQFNKSANGVSWSNRSRKWKASIKLNRKSIHLGYFDNEQEGRAAYLSAKTEYHTIRADQRRV